MAEKPRPVVESLGSLPDLRPAARGVDSYARPGQVAYGKPASTNPFLQLSEALAQIEPTLRTVASVVAKDYSEEEYARADADFMANRDKWNSLIKAGKIPESLSPYYTRGLQRASLKQLGSEYLATMENAFYGPEGAEARASNDPNKMTALLKTVQEKFTKEHLQGPDGDRRYSDLDIHEVFNPLAEQGYQRMLQTHAAYRVKERELEAEAAVTTQLGQFLDAVIEEKIPYADRDKHKHFLTFTATKMNDVLYNEDTGFVKNGMPGTKANQLMVDTVVAKMMASGDRSVGEVLQYVTTKGGASVAKTQYAISKLQAAEEHITAQEIQKEHFQAWKDDRPFHLQSQQHTQQAWVREDKRYQRELEQYQHSQGKIATEEVVKTFERRIFEGLRRNADEGVKIIDTAMRELEIVDPKEAAYMRGVIHTLTKQRSDYEDDPLTVALLRTDMSRNPLAFSQKRLVAAVEEKKLKSSTFMQMMDDLERNRQNGDHPLLRQHDFISMMNKVERGALKNAGDEFGADGAIRASEATGEFRDLALEWIENNPNGSHAAFNVYMRSKIREVLERNNEDFGRDQRHLRNAQEKKGREIQQGTSAEVRQRELDEQDRQAEKAENERRQQEQESKLQQQRRRQEEIKTGQRTKEGRKVIDLGNGEFETEKTITVTDKRLNDGRPTNIPTIFDGKHVSDEEAVEIIVKNKGVDPDTGRKLPGFYPTNPFDPKSAVDAAVIAAQERSEKLGREIRAARRSSTSTVSKPLTVNHLRTLMTTDEKIEIGNLQKQFLNPGTGKPISEGHVKDRVMEILKPHYEANGQSSAELAEGVDEFMAQLFKRKKKD